MEAEKEQSSSDKQTESTDAHQDSDKQEESTDTQQGKT